MIGLHPLYNFKGMKVSFAVNLCQCLARIISVLMDDLF